MIRTALATAAAVFLLAASTGAQAASPDTIKARGKLICPVPTSALPGFSELDSQGQWKGFDIDLCRSLATAILGTPDKAEFTAISWANRVPALQSGTIDAVIMLTGWVRSRDVKLGMQFTNPYFFGASQLMVPATLKVSSAKQLDGATICSVAGSTTTTNVDGYLRSLSVKHEMLTFEKTSDSTAAYKAGRCEAIAQYGPSNAFFRAAQLDVPGHVILPDMIGMEPESIAVKQGDDALLDMANWTLAALVQADILGITSKNVDAIAADSTSSPDQKRLLGVLPGVGDGFGLDDRWAYRVIKLNGSYGEMFDRDLGQGSPYKMVPGQNQPWTHGGLLFSPVFD